MKIVKRVLLGLAVLFIVLVVISNQQIPAFAYFVGREGLEPSPRCRDDILSVARMPVPPPTRLFPISPAVSWLKTMAIWTKDSQIFKAIIFTVSVYMVKF